MSQGLEYAVDLVFCIDKTGSMSPVINRVKEHALRFDSDLRERMKIKSKEISELRVRVIAFGDLYHDKDAWLLESDFLSLPDSSDQFKEFISNIKVDGGGDEPENGLEALALAIKSRWTTAGHRRRHVIVIWTDATAHPLEMRAEKGISKYQELPTNFDALKDEWDSQSIGANGRRLLIFAPEAYPWSDVFNHFDEAILFPSKAGQGLAEHEYEQILDVITASI